MVVYNVTIKVKPSIAEEWIKWMKEEHVPELMQTGLFYDHRLFHLLEQDEKEGITYIVQYFCNNIEDYNTYLRKHAQRLREMGFQRFGDGFIAFRTLMEILE